MWKRRAPKTAKGDLTTSEGNDAAAELVCFGFRGWMLGLRNGDLTQWEAVWMRYRGLLGTVQARCIVSELEGWTRQIHLSACRPIRVECLNCPARSIDERLAVSIIAAAQHNTCPAMRACAFTLLETPNIDPMLERAGAFADALMQSDQVLAPWSVTAALETEAASSRTLH